MCPPVCAGSQSDSVIRNYEGGKAFCEEMKPGLSVRLTDGVLSSIDGAETPVINLSMVSEAVFLEEHVHAS